MEHNFSLLLLNSRFYHKPGEELNAVLDGGFGIKITTAE